MTYANSDNYLLLKQMLVALKLKHLGGIVEVGNVEITKDGALTDKICGLIALIEADFTMPYALLRDMPIHVDLSYMLSKMPMLHDILPDECELKGSIPNIEDTKGLYTLIFECPDVDGYMAECRNRLNSYTNTRKLAGEMVTAFTDALTRIRKWAEVSDDILPLPQILTLLNAVEVIDWIFAYTNDYYGVPENDLKREQPGQ